MSGWVEHFPTGNGRCIPSDTPIEAELIGQGIYRNYAGNFDNWRWREASPCSVLRYRLVAGPVASGAHAFEQWAGKR